MRLVRVGSVTVLRADWLGNESDIGEAAADGFILLPAAEEESLVFDRGAAGGEPVIIFIEPRGGTADGIGGVEKIILEDSRRLGRASC